MWKLVKIFQDEDNTKNIQVSFFQEDTLKKKKKEI